MKRSPARFLTPVLAAATAATLPGAPAAAQPRDPFQLNAVQQAFLDQVLSAWEVESAKVQTFNCPFTRWEYNAFSPAADIAFSIDDGQISFQKPDKGSFRVTRIKRWTPKPAAPGAAAPARPAGEHLEPKDDRGNPTVVGEHWVCDGKSLYDFKHEQRQLHVQPIPPAMQGTAIVDGPLPFVFGAKAETLKQKYDMFIREPAPAPNVIQIVARPRSQTQAADFRGVEVQLDKNRMLPIGMQLWDPAGGRSVYLFHLDQASVNARRDRLWALLFQAPRTPRGWKRVDLPVRQAAAEAPPQR